MVTHLAVFQPKDATTEEQIAGLLTQARALAESIPGIIDVTVGRELRRKAPEYTWGFALRLVDKQALDGYYPHPSHRAFATNLKALAEKILDFDIAD